MTRTKGLMFRPRALALLALSTFAFGSACYSTVPHRAQVASSSTQPECNAAITDVFARSGFVQLPTPPHLSMFFGARMGGPYSSFLTIGSGVGVTVDDEAGRGGMCRVTLEALSPDAGCPNALTGTGAAMGMGTTDTSSCQNGVIGGGAFRYGAVARASAPCPIVSAPRCELSSAPGADNDAAVDELARRVKAALGPSSQVN